MRRFASAAALAAIAFACILSASCGNSNPTKVVPNSVPAKVAMTPSPNASIELGKTLSFTATAQNGVGTALTETFQFISSNPSVVTVSNTGVACAGTWDSLSAPTVCTPGGTGTAQVSAVAQGVSSPPVTVYIHQHVTSVTISPVPGQPPTLSTLCLSKGPVAGPESTLYQAFAFAGDNTHPNTDITASVGPFTWQTINATGQTTSAVTLSTIPAGSTQCIAGGQGACLNQERATANSPGSSFLFASAGGASSTPVQFTTCPVQSISISALDDPSTSFVLPTSGTKTLNATVTDILNLPLTGVPLTWSSNNPVSVKVTGATSTVYGSVGTVSASTPGAGSVTASCTPPTCNGGITPSLPIYPKQAISFHVEPATNFTAPTPTVYVSSTGCNPPGNSTNQACTTRIIPVTRASSTAALTPGNPISLPFNPNSLLFDQQGTNAYLGVNSLSFGTQGVMVVNGSTVNPVANAAGRILATSPDGTLAIFSDTADTPNRVFICQSCSSASSANVATVLFNGATAAAFSVDNISGGYKAYIVSGQSCPGTSSAGCLLVYSKVDAAKTVPLGAPATDVAFIGNGTLGYIAGGDPAGTAFLPTCDNPSAPGSIGSVPLPAQFIRALPDGQSAIALHVPDVQTVSASITGMPTGAVAGCPKPRGFLDVANFVAPPLSLGVSSFTPTQFFLSPDASTAYVLGQNGSGSTAARLPFIIALNLATQAVSNISLAGNATPLSASISPAGDFLFVGADDGQLHLFSTVTQLDTQQVAFPFSQSSLCVGPGNPPTSVETDMTITSATQSGSTTTFTYGSVSGPALQVGETITVKGMTNPVDNGTFTISALTGTTFTVSNPDGVTLSAESGTGVSGVICLPDLVSVKP